MIGAPHGAGVTNIVFCSPGAKVVELFTHTYGMCTFWILAANLGLPYATYMMNEAQDEQERRDHDVSVDVADMMGRVRNFLGL